MGKKIQYKWFILSFAIILIASCKKDGNDLITKLTATIDGKSWVSTLRVTAKNDNGFIITASNINTSLVTSELIIKINGANSGTYSVIAASNNCLATYTPDISQSSKSFVSATGSVTLTDVDTKNKTISGTFEFVCTNLSLETVQITNGSFSGLSYTETSGN